MSDATPVFNQFNLVVRDMDRTVAFYRRLGLTIPDTAPEWASHHRTAAMPGDIDLDFDSLEFARRWSSGWRSVMGVLGFRVPNRDAVDAVHGEIILAGYRSQQEPYDAFWGARYAIVEDPDGNAVGLMSPSEDSRRSRPPEPRA